MSGLGKWILDGVPLDDPTGRWIVSDATKPRGIPVPAIASASVPGRHGVLSTVPKWRGPATQTIGLLVTDNDPAGNPTGAASQARANLEYLQALATPISRLPILRHARSAAAGDYAEAPVRLLAAVETEMVDPHTYAMVLPFEIPSVYMIDGVEHVITSPSTSTWTAAPPELIGTTGSIIDPVFRCAGALSKVIVTDTTTGRVLTWEGTVSGGQYVRIHPATMQAFRTTSATWTGGTDVSGGLSAGPDGFDLNPGPDLTVGWVLTRSGGAGVNVARVRRAFL